MCKDIEHQISQQKKSTTTTTFPRETGEHKSFLIKSITKDRKKGHGFNVASHLVTCTNTQKKKYNDYNLGAGRSVEDEQVHNNKEIIPTQVGKALYAKMKIKKIKNHIGENPQFPPLGQG